MAKNCKNVFSLVSKLTSDVQAVETCFDELSCILKEKKIRAFSCAAITLEGEVIYQYSFDNDMSLYSLIGSTEIMKENLIKDSFD